MGRRELKFSVIIAFIFIFLGCEDTELRRFLHEEAFPDVEFSLKWGESGTENGQFDFGDTLGGGTAGGITVDSHGNVFVGDSGNSRIQKFSAQGEFVLAWGQKSTGASQPVYMAIDGEGNLYVSDRGGRIQKFDFSGRILDQWAEQGSANGQFSDPMGIAVDQSNNIFVVDAMNYRIQKFDGEGQFLMKWGEPGDLPGEFSYPSTIAIDSNGFIYVSDNTRIQKFTVDGTSISQWPGGPTPGIAVDSDDNVYFTTSDGVEKFDSNGIDIGGWGSTGQGPGEFSFPHAIAIDSSDRVYVADSGNNRIQVFDSDGTFLFQWGTAGRGSGEFDEPRGIAVHADGTVFVTDTGNVRVQKFDAAGTYLSQWGTTDYDFGNIHALDVDSGDNVYALSLYAEFKVKKFNNNGIFLTEWKITERDTYEIIGGKSFDIDSFDRLYVPDYGNNTVEVYDKSGNLLNQWSASGQGDTVLDSPSSIVISSNGEVYVGHVNQNPHDWALFKPGGIVIFDSLGNHINEWIGSVGDIPFQVDYGDTVFCIDGEGHIYLNNIRNQAITKIDQQGNYLFSWGVRSQLCDDCFSDSIGDVAVDDSGNIYVIDASSDSLHKFIPAQ